MRASGRASRGLVGGAVLACALGACAPRSEVASAPAERDRAAPNAPLPARAPLPTGASIAAMSDQYAQPRRGAVAAAGASSWVAPAPPAAFVISTPLPPGDPPPPPPAAVANRQPTPPAAPTAPAAGVARSEAAAAPAASADLAAGRRLFAQYACGSCHVLADGGGTGGIGPSLDNNPQLTRDYVLGAIAEGRGAMPAFRDQMSADEIATLAAYVVAAARK